MNKMRHAFYCALSSFPFVYFTVPFPLSRLFIFMLLLGNPFFKIFFILCSKPFSVFSKWGAGGGGGGAACYWGFYLGGGGKEGAFYTKYVVLSSSFLPLNGEICNVDVL